MCNVCTEANVFGNAPRFIFEAASRLLKVLLPLDEDADTVVKYYYGASGNTFNNTKRKTGGK